MLNKLLGSLYVQVLMGVTAGSALGMVGPRLAGDLKRLGDLLVFSPTGKVIPLGQVASIQRVVGPSEIASENGRLRAFVQTNVTGRDLGSFVEVR